MPWAADSYHTFSRLLTKERHPECVLDCTMLMDVSDLDLVVAANSGDRSAFSTLISRHYDHIYGLSWRLTGSPIDAEDLAQDVCISLPRKIATFRGESSFTTWLYRIVVNAAHDARRRTASRARATAGWGDWETARQQDIVAERDAYDWLASAMGQLAPDLRDTVALVLGEEMTQAQAAAILGVSEGTVAWRMSEVKKSLRKLAKEETGS